jgi:hypothetical protein
MQINNLEQMKKKRGKMYNMANTIWRIQYGEYKMAKTIWRIVTSLVVSGNIDVNIVK